MMCTRGTPAMHAAAACCTFESMSGAKPALSSRSSLLSSATSICRISWPRYTRPSCGRDVDQLDGLQLFRNRHRDAVGIHPIRLAVAVESQRRNDRYDALREQRLQELGVDALDLAREQMVHALNDAERVGDDHVRGGGAQIVGRQAFENLVSQAVGGRQRQLERRRIRDAGAVEIRGGDRAALRRAFGSAPTRRERARSGCSATRAAPRPATASRSCRS